MNRNLHARPVVVIVDDEQSICWALGRFFDGMGLETVEVPTAEEAINAVEALVFVGREVALLVVDMCLPGMNGADAVARIRRTLGVAAPVIAISGHPRDWFGSRLAGLGVEAFLSKPLDMDRLEEVVERVALLERA
jgi:DNA-binding NtrC family response regulator